MWFVHHRINRMNPCLTSRSSAPAPQGSLVFSGFVGWRGALIVGVGHVEERARALRAAGSMAILGSGCFAIKKNYISNNQ